MNERSRIRSERIKLADRDSIEKYRLEKRVEGFAVYNNPGNILQPGSIDSNSIRPWGNSKLLTDDVELSKVSPSLTKKGKHDSLVRRCDQNKTLDIKQKSDECRRELAEANILLLRRDSGYMAKANVGGSAYNIINKEYNDTIAGNRLKYHDELVNYRSQLRANHLASRSHAGFNPITGALTLKFIQPEMPEPPVSNTLSVQNMHVRSTMHVEKIGENFRSRMKVVVQRVNCATVTVNDKIVGEIQKGLLLLLGIDRYDTKYEHAFPCSIACRESIEKMIQKTLKIRVWDSPELNGPAWSRTVVDMDYEILLVSQFTVHGSFKKGNKPDFHCAMTTELAREAFSACVDRYKVLYKPDRIQTGSFGEYTQVSLMTDENADVNEIWTEFETLSKSRPLRVRNRVGTIVRQAIHFDLANSEDEAPASSVSATSPMSPTFSVPDEVFFPVECPSIPPLPSFPVVRSLNPRVKRIASIFLRALMYPQVVRSMRLSFPMKKLQKKNEKNVSSVFVWIDNESVCWRNNNNMDRIRRILIRDILRLDFGKNSICYRKSKNNRPSVSSWNSFSLITVDRSYDFFSTDTIVEDFIIGFSIIASNSTSHVPEGLITSSSKLRWIRASLKINT